MGTASFVYRLRCLCRDRRLFCPAYLHMPQNIYKTSNEILEISSIIESDSAATGLEKRTLYSSQQLLELRQYDPSIRGILRRNDLLDWSIDPDDETQIADVIASNHHLHRLAPRLPLWHPDRPAGIFNKRKKMYRQLYYLSF